MTSRSLITVFALAGALTSPAFANDPVGKASDRAMFPYGDSATRVEVTDGPSQAAMLPSIEGRVTAVEHDSGHLVVDTEEGPISLMAAPEELAGVEVGDTIRVSLIVEERD